MKDSYSFDVDDAGLERPELARTEGPYFVSPDAIEREADGTRERPFLRAEAAFALARPGELIVLLPGDHPAWTQPPPRGVEVQGLSRARVRLAGPVLLANADTALRNLTVHGGAPGVRTTASARIENVLVEDTPGNGVEVGAGPFSATELEIRGAAAVGFLANVGPVDLTDIRVDGARGGGIRLTGIDTTARGLDVRNVVLDVEEVRANGVEIEGGQAEIHGLTVGEVGDRAIRIAQGARVVLTDVVVTGPAADGIAVLSGADATLTGFRVSGAQSVGLTVNEASAHVTDGRIVGGGRAGALFSKGASDVEGLQVLDAPVRGIAILRAQGRFAGLDVQRAADVGLQITDPAGPITVVDAHFADNGVSGIAAFGTGTGSVRLERVLVEGTRLGADELGEGLHVYEAELTVIDSEFRGNAGAGVLVDRASLTVERTRLTANLGAGLATVDAAGAVRLTEVHAEGNHGAGVLAIGGTLFTQDCAVTATAPAPDGTGDGVELVAGAVAVMVGDALWGNAGHGLMVFGDAHVTATDLDAHENGGYGVYVACDASTAVLEGVPVLAGNAAGPRNACP